MMLYLLIGVSAIMSTMAVSPQGAHPPAPACAVRNAALSADLAPWRDRPAATGSRIAIGRAATFALGPASAFRYVVPPEKPGPAGTFGGTATFDVPRAGTYRIAISEGAWIDVVRNGRIVASSAHGRGPECSTIHKIVSFPLTPGRHTLQFSGSPKAVIAVLVTSPR